MAALPTTGLKMSAVATALGVSTSDIDLENLCTHANVNVWARYKPGYLKAGAGADFFIVYQEPQGIGFTDPRGIDAEYGHNKESFKLGDFRGYDHASDAPYGAFPSSTIEFSSGTSTSFGISVTFYVEDINMKSNSSSAYREQHGFADLTHVHILDASDNSIEGTAAIPSPGGNVSLPVDGVAMSQGVPVTKTYHIAFGVDSTHWSVKLGTLDGAGGIGTITVLRLEAAKVNGAQFIDTSFGGGDNPPYSSCEITGSTTYAIASSDTATFKFAATDAFRCYHAGGSDYYKNIAATWFVKGFHENPNTEYEYKDANIASNNATNTVDLGGTWVDTPPHSTWEDGDSITLVLRDLTINF